VALVVEVGVNNGYDLQLMTRSALDVGTSAMS